MTPEPVAALMAGMISAKGRSVRILDAGAGCGSLFAAAIAELCGRNVRPAHIHVTAIEIDPNVLPFLDETVDLCRRFCDGLGVQFTCTVKREDFLDYVASNGGGSLFGEAESYDLAIQNPPYGKIGTSSRERNALRAIGLEASNIYAGFLGATSLLLKDGGELISITPRSFCNGTYFKAFRAFFLDRMTLQRLHVFNSRAKAFRDDAVLQETVILAAVKGAKRGSVLLTSSADAHAEDALERELDYRDVVRPNDREQFIHLQTDELSSAIAERMAELPCTLADLGLKVSTGRVVDFRATEFLRASIDASSVPLLYPLNLQGGEVVWPVMKSKPQALSVAAETQGQLVPSAHYVLVKRFSAKEERRRVVAGLYDPADFAFGSVAIENHLNYFHANGAGLDPITARGLWAYLNSSMVDAYFRQFNGHTQVNAGDLKSLRYPDIATLQRVGRLVSKPLPQQDAIDQLIREEVFSKGQVMSDPVQQQKRINEAVGILKDLGLPRQQLNERSGLSLLALLNLKASDDWSTAQEPLIGITPIMSFAEAEYGKKYAPNTRETFRRQTMHQFIEAGLAVSNPDKPDRAINSPQWVYQVTPEALKLLRTYGTDKWQDELKTFLAMVGTLKAAYAKARTMNVLPVKLSTGEELALTPGGQNVLVKEIIEQFAPRFTPGGVVLYAGDTGKKDALYDKEALAALGVVINDHGKIPDVIIHYTERNWLVLIEAVTSHGPIDAKRHGELKTLFAGSKAGLVFVTTFLDRKAMREYLPEICWETEVWVADAPDHLIHFNGERFLGPY